jgi:hypothetical protein
MRGWPSAARLGITEYTVGNTIMFLCAVGVSIRTFLLGHLVDRFGEARLAPRCPPLPVWTNILFSIIMKISMFARSHFARVP